MVWRCFFSVSYSVEKKKPEKENDTLRTPHLSGPVSCYLHLEKALPLWHILQMSSCRAGPAAKSKDNCGFYCFRCWHYHGSDTCRAGLASVLLFCAWCNVTASPYSGSFISYHLACEDNRHLHAVKSQYCTYAMRLH